MRIFVLYRDLLPVLRQLAKANHPPSADIGPNLSALHGPPSIFTKPAECTNIPRDSSKRSFRYGQFGDSRKPTSVRRAVSRREITLTT